MLVTTKEILDQAQNAGYAVGAFNVSNMEQVQAVVAAAESENMPAIIQTSEGALKYAGLAMLGSIVICAAQKSPVPIALHLDHGTTFETIEACIKYGWTSVMIDASASNFELNVVRTKKVVEMAHRSNVSVEAELGRIVGTEDQILIKEGNELFTDPDEASEFVERTGVDSLAIAIGTAHGKYKGEPKLDFERLKLIKNCVKVPLVLHGASGLSDRDLQQAVRLGINKINIDTDLRQAFADGCREAFAKNRQEYDVRKICGYARKKMFEVVSEKIRIFSLK